MKTVLTRISAVAIAMVVLGAMGLVGCGNNSADNATTADVPTSVEVKTVVVTQIETKDDSADKAEKKQEAISKAKAKKIALKDAADKYRIKNADVYEFQIEKDPEDGQWEIEFKAKKNGLVYDYDYDIAIKNGEILKGDEERDDD